MPGKGSVIDGPSASLEVRYTEKPVSGWGGLVAVVKYMDRLGIRTLLQRALADGRTSPNQIPGGRHSPRVYGRGADRSVAFCAC